MPPSFILLSIDEPYRNRTNTKRHFNGNLGNRRDAEYSMAPPNFAVLVKPWGIVVHRSLILECVTTEIPWSYTTLNLDSGLNNV